MQSKLKDMESVTLEVIKKIQKQQEAVIEKALRTFADPPIKGEITKGKIKWRGIKLIVVRNFMKEWRWLEQRGKQISPKMLIEFKQPNINTDAE